MVAADTSVGRTLENALGIDINSSKQARQPPIKICALAWFRVCFQNTLLSSLAAKSKELNVQAGALNYANLAGDCPLVTLKL